MVRLLTALLAALSLTACTAPPAPPTASSAPQASTGPCHPQAAQPAPSERPLRVTVMTYNVLGGWPPLEWLPQIDKAELDPVKREPATVELIRQVDADVIGLQEYRVADGAGAQLAADLDQYTWVTQPEAGYEALALPILYRTSRFDCLAAGTRQVTAVGEHGSVLDRNVNWVELLDRDSGRRFFVFNHHAHPWQTDEFAAVRSATIDRVIEVMDEVNPSRAEPFLLAGDFNARNNDTRPVYGDHLRKLREAGLVDSATIAAKDTSNIPRAASMNKMSAKVKGEYVGKVIRRNGQHIDYIWVPKGTKVRSWATVSGPDVKWRKVRGQKVPVWSGIVPSDHSPVVAELRFPKG